MILHLVAFPPSSVLGNLSSLPPSPSSSPIIHRSIVELPSTRSAQARLCDTDTTPSIPEEHNDPEQTSHPRRFGQFLNRDRIYWRRKARPLGRFEPGTKPGYPAKPGKRQNVPKTTHQIILELQSSTPEELLITLKKCANAYKPERADWLYVLKYFEGKRDKSLYFQIYDFVLLEESFETAARDYTNLMLAHIDMKNYEAVEKTMKIMEDRDIYPDLVVYTVLLAMYGKVGTLDLVKEKFSEMKSWGLKPDTIVYCALIEAYCHFGHPREAESFLEEMEKANLPLKLEIFIPLIRGYGNVGQTKEAERIFHLLQLKCLYPDRRAYSALMDAYTKDDDLEHARQVFENMVSVGIKPTDKSLARLITACQNRNLLAEATDLLQKLESKSLRPGTETLVIFSGWLDKLGLEEEVQVLYREIRRRRGSKVYVTGK